MSLESDTRGRLNRYDALASVPIKSADIEEHAVGESSLILTYQVQYRPMFQKIRRLVARGHSKGFTRKVELDLLGVGVWRLIDGKNNVQTIVRRFARTHTLDIREAEVSVTLFLRSLGKKGLIGMR
ncbi:MAG: PqqD family protein [Desulfobacterium sp.]|jgi:hypothetical protein|nr:PqqD family protein [Desulfobacterium sp.]